MSNDYIKLFLDFEEYKDFVLSNRQKNKLHPLAEPNLQYILKEIYPESHPISEINVDGGRVDLLFYFSPLHSIHFEIFASEGQVNKDTLLLIRSPSDIQIAILIDDEIDSRVSKKFFRTNPDSFIHFNLSQIFMESKINDFKREIGNIIKCFQLKPDSEVKSLRNSLLRCYEAIKKLCYLKFDLEESETVKYKEEINKLLTLLIKYKEDLNEYMDFHFDVKQTEFDGVMASGDEPPNYEITLEKVKIYVYLNINNKITGVITYLNDPEYGMVMVINKSDFDPFLNEQRNKLNF